MICTSSGCTDSVSGNDPDVVEMPVITVESRNYTLAELDSFVQNATDFARKAGKQAASAAFSDPEGDYVDGNLYIYGLDYEGKYLAHPFRPDLTGSEGINRTDANGMRFVEACRDVAEAGGGYILYTYPDPADEMKSGEKLGLIYPVDNEWWIGSGIYLDDLVDENGSTPFDLAYVKDFVINASYFAESVSKEDAVVEFSNSRGEYFDFDNGMYIIAIDYEGNVIAHPVSHDIIGENIYDNEMKYGVKSIQRASEIARNGGGFIIYSYDNDYGDLEQSLNYIMPVEKDDYWIISSGISLSDLTR
ncbi:MAG: cache domain-containing protein [Methanomicrobiaceae archaeon]|nr:cache domain-containing protein [Methanomicrobiaceae archaeon]